MFIRNCIELRRMSLAPEGHSACFAWVAWSPWSRCVWHWTAGCCMGMGWQGTRFFFNSETPTMAFCNCNAVKNQNSKNERFAILRLKHTAFRSTGGWRRNRHFLHLRAPWPLHQPVITFIIIYRHLGPWYWRQVRLIFCHLPLATIILIFPCLCKIDQCWRKKPKYFRCRPAPLADFLRQPSVLSQSRNATTICTLPEANLTNIALKNI